MINQMTNQACPVSQSLLWQIMQQQYKLEKTEIWEKVPCGITNSLYLARQYTDLIKKVKSQTDKPICVVELGSGISRLAYYLLKLNQDIHYTMVDLRPDFETFIAHHPDWVSVPTSRYNLVEGGCDALYKYLQESNCAADVYYIFITHYVLDSLPTDIWEKVDDAWLPVGIKLSGAKRAFNCADFDKLKLGFYRGEKHQVSDAYKRALESSVEGKSYHYATMPVGGFELLDHLKSVCPNALWLIADKVLMQQSRPDKNFGFRRDHAWSISVNFQAMMHYAESLGCAVEMDCGHQSEIIHVMAVGWGDCAVGLQPMGSLASYFEIIEMLGTASKIQVQHAIGFLRLGGFDPWVLQVLGDSVDADLSESDHRRPLWLDTLRQTMQWTYYHKGDKDLFVLADIFMRTRAYDDAKRVLELCGMRYGQNERLLVLWGQFFFRQGDHDKAKSFWQEAKKLYPASERVKRFVNLVS